MIFIKNMENAPIVGAYNEEIISLSKKIAEAYNASINNISPKKFLGFSFKRIDELKNYKASLNFDDRTLEININENTKIIIPSAYSEVKHLNKYFEFSSNFKNDSLLFENAINKYNITEKFSLKGKAPKFFSRNIKSGIKSAKKFFSRDIELSSESSSTIDQISTNIVKDMKKILGVDVDSEKLSIAIKGFMTEGNSESLNKLYDEIYKSTLETKYVKSCSEEIKKIVSKSKVYEEIKGATPDSEILDAVAKSYNVSEKDLEERNQDKKFTEVISKIHTYITNGFGAILNGIKGVLLSAAAFETFRNGVLSLMSKTIKYTIKGVIKLIQMILGPTAQRKSYEDALIKGDTGILDKTAAYLSKVNSYVTTEGLDSIDALQSTLLDKVGKITSYVEDLSYFGTIKYLVFILIAYLAFKYIYNFITNISTISKQGKTDNKDLALNFSIDDLASNFGFDKILATEGIMYIIIAHLQSAIDKKQLQSPEASKAKDIIRLIHKSHKVKTKEGIRFFYEEMNELQNSLSV